MNQEQCLKVDILEHRTLKALRGFRWKKRSFRLYHDRIVYATTPSDVILGEIPLNCITKLLEGPDKTCFTIILGNFRTFDLQASSASMAHQWLERLHAMTARFSHLDRDTLVKQHKDRFWKMDTSGPGYVRNNFQPFTKENGVTNKLKAAAPPHSQTPTPASTTTSTKYTVRPKQPLSQTPTPHMQMPQQQQHNLAFRESAMHASPQPPPFDRGGNRYRAGGFNNNPSISPVSEEQEYHPLPQTSQTPVPHSSTTANISGDKNHRRGAQSNKFWGNRESKKIAKKNTMDAITDDDHHHHHHDDHNGVIGHSQTMPTMLGSPVSPAPPSSHPKLSSSPVSDIALAQSPRPTSPPDAHAPRLSIMDSVLPSGINGYRVEDLLYDPWPRDAHHHSHVDMEQFMDDEYIAPFGKVAIVCTHSIQSRTPFLLQVMNKSHAHFETAKSAMDRMQTLINPYVLTQLQRGETLYACYATYNCPSNGSLSNCLQLFRNMSITSTRIILAEVVCGLHYLHEHNFNFPNLSPANLFISHRAHLLFTDFAFVLPNTSRELLHRCGPLCYAPPEFLLHGKDDLKSDWWRLGVLLYHLLVGTPPFVGTADQIREQICHAVITKESLFNSEEVERRNIEFDAGTKDFILRLLTRDRKERLGCKRPSSQQLKKSFGLKNRHQFYGVDEVMNHAFFESIWSKRNRSYAYTWPQIQKREHKAAPILRHLASRRTFFQTPSSEAQTPPKPAPKFGHAPSMNKQVSPPKPHEYDSNHWEYADVDDVKSGDDDENGSVADTTDEDDYDDEEDEKSFRDHSLSKSNPNTGSGGNGNGGLVLPTINDDMPADDVLNIDSLNSNLSAQNALLSGYGSPVHSTPLSLSQSQSSAHDVNSYVTGAVGPGSSPSTQSPSAASGGLSGPSRMSPIVPHALKSAPNLHNHYPAPPSQSPRFDTHHTSQASETPVPAAAASLAPSTRRSKGHKQFGIPPPPMIDINVNVAAAQPPSANMTPTKYHVRPKTSPLPNRQLPPSPAMNMSHMNHRQGLNGAHAGHGGGNGNGYMQQQRTRHPMAAQAAAAAAGKYGGVNYAVPRLDNLHDQDEKRDLGDASTVVSDQIAAAAMLRQPIMTAAAHFKQQQKEAKGKQKQKKAKKQKKKKAHEDGFHVKEQAVIQKAKTKLLTQIRDKTESPVAAIKKPTQAPQKRLTGFEKMQITIRSKVSKKKRRFIDKVHGFNLDLTYVTKRIIAMGFPAEGNEAMYRNPSSEVIRFFGTYHHNKFKVYNLCIEADRQYEHTKFTSVGGECAKYGFKDHNSPELELILKFCEDLHEWLSRDKDNVAAIHCKAGKGRTGVMICSYLAYSKICKNAQEALQKYGLARTKNDKGVTIPSQRRYVLYFANFVLNPALTANPARFEFHKICILKRIRMNTVPDFDLGGGCDPYFVIYNINGDVLYDYSRHYQVRSEKYKSKRKKPKKKKSKKKPKHPAFYVNDVEEDMMVAPIIYDPDDCVKFQVLDVVLSGSFKIVFFDRDKLSSDDKMCWCWHHSAVAAQERHIWLPRDEVDGAVKDKAYKHFAHTFGLEFWFETPTEETTETLPNLHDWITHNEAWLSRTVASPTAQQKQKNVHFGGNVPPHAQQQPPPRNLNAIMMDNLPPQSTALRSTPSANSMHELNPQQQHHKHSNSNNRLRLAKSNSTHGGVHPKMNRMALQHSHSAREPDNLSPQQQLPPPPGQLSSSTSAASPLSPLPTPNGHHKRPSLRNAYSGNDGGQRQAPPMQQTHHHPPPMQQAQQQQQQHRQHPPHRQQQHSHNNNPHVRHNSASQQLALNNKTHSHPPPDRSGPHHQQGHSQQNSGLNLDSVPEPAMMSSPAPGQGHTRKRSGQTQNIYDPHATQKQRQPQQQQHPNHANANPFKKAFDQRAHQQQHQQQQQPPRHHQQNSNDRHRDNNTPKFGGKQSQSQPQHNQLFGAKQSQSNHNPNQRPQLQKQAHPPPQMYRNNNQRAPNQQGQQGNRNMHRNHGNQHQQRPPPNNPQFVQTQSTSQPHLLDKNHSNANRPPQQQQQQNMNRRGNSNNNNNPNANYSQNYKHPNHNQNHNHNGYQNPNPNPNHANSNHNHQQHHNNNKQYANYHNHHHHHQSSAQPPRRNPHPQQAMHSKYQPPVSQNDPKHLHRNGAAVQPPPIPSNSSMMRTLEQNVQHHLTQNNSDVSRKVTIV